MRAKILIGTLATFLAVFSTYIGYRLAFTASQETGVVFYMVLARQQKECMDTNNIACLETTNKLLRDIVATQASVLREKSISNHLNKQLDDFINWNNSIKDTDPRKTN